MIGVIKDTWNSMAKMCQSSITHVSHLCSDCQYYIFQQLLQITQEYEKTSVVVACKTMWQNVRAYRTITKNPCPNMNAELLLESNMDYTMRILFCPLVLVVNIDDAISTEMNLICKQH
jgi:hypothetical protein